MQKQLTISEAVAQYGKQMSHATQYTLQQLAGEKNPTRNMNDRRKYGTKTGRVFVAKEEEDR